MGTTAEKLTYLNETKTQLKDMLNLGGANITTEPFRQYVDTLKNRYLYFMNNGTQQVWDNWDKATDSGTEMSLNNTEEAPMSLVYKGNTSQNGTPTPDSPVPIQVVSGDNSIVVCGKNLAYTGWVENFVSRINNTNLATLETFDNRNCLKWKEQAGYGDYDNKYMFKINWKENTQYTFSFDLYTTNQYGYGNVLIKYTDNTSTEFMGTQDTWTHQTVTSTSGKTIKYVQPNWRAGYGYIDLDTFQVEEGTQATTYEPYTGESYPITLPEGMFLGWIPNTTYQDKIDKSSGKNLFDKDNPTIPNADMSYGQIISKNDTNCWFFEVDTNKTYTLTKQSYNYGYIGYSNTKPVIGTSLSNRSSIANETTITINPTDKYLCIFISKSDNLNVIQLEEGTATEYEPYGTGWYVKKEIGKVVLDGSETWSYFSVTQGSLFRVDNIVNDVIQNNTIVPMCNRYHAIAYSQQQNRTNNDIYLSLVGQIDILDNTYNNATNFKTWLSSNNVEVRYVLATPTYTLIEDNTLISQLEALKSKTGQTNISQTNNDMPFELDVVALSQE